MSLKAAMAEVVVNNVAKHGVGHHIDGLEYGKAACIYLHNNITELRNEKVFKSAEAVYVAEMIQKMIREEGEGKTEADSLPTASEIQEVLAEYAVGLKNEEETSDMILDFLKERRDK